MGNLIDYFDSPLKLGVNVEEPKLGHKIVENNRGESFSQNIFLLVLSIDMEELDDSLLDFFSYQMAIYLYMLCPLIEYLVGSNLYC